MIGKLHHSRDGRIEAHFLQILGNFLDRDVQPAQGFAIRLDILHCIGKLHFIGTIVDQQPPDSRKKTVDSFDPPHAPGFGGLQGAHEHLIEAHAVGAVFIHDVVRVDNISPALGHFVGARVHPNRRILF